MTQRSFALILAFATWCAICAQDAQAQSRRNTRNDSFSGSGQGLGNQSGFGAQSTTGRNTGFGGQQGGQFGRSGAATGQMGAGLGQGQQGQMGGSQFDPRQQAGGMAQSATDQGGFVGGDAQDMRASFEGMSGRDRRRAMFDFMLENLNQMRDRRNERDSRRREPDAVRVQLRPPVNMPLMDSQQVSVTMQTNVTRSQEIQRLPAPQIELNGRTATVSGAVASDHERAVIEKMISMQPGVSQVQSRLTVDPSASGPASVGTVPSSAASPTE